MDSNNIELVKNYLLSLQDKICDALEKEDGAATFLEDAWNQNDIGNGRTRIISDGNFIEKGGVNFSHVKGAALPAAITSLEPELIGCPFQAMGVSVVIHPINPYVPTTHLNIRFFVAQKANSEFVWWFGGGFDLTPYYGFTEDCKHWHQIGRAACIDFGNDVYPLYKKACDEYFFIKHRNEMRGIGGLFFDHLSAWGFEKCFQFMQNVGNNFLTAYLPIVARRKNIAYTVKERDFQLYRRGRYVEYNLIYDRGTLFGLQFGGRIESILMSLPPQVTWKYNWKPEKNSAEEKLYAVFLKPQDWINWQEK